MLKDLAKTGKEIEHAIADYLPAFFPKRARRVKWANSLPDDMITELTKAKPAAPNDQQVFDIQFSALGWGCVTFIANNRDTRIEFVDHAINIDGVRFTNFMPAEIRKWYGISELDALKIQSLNLNGAPKTKIKKQIKDI